MKLQIRFLCAVSLFLAVLTFTHQASASAYVSVTKVKTLRRYGITAACAIKSNFRGTLGTLRGNRFRAGIVTTQARARRFAADYKKAKRDCQILAKAAKEAAKNRNATPPASVPQAPSSPPVVSTPAPSTPPPSGNVPTPRPTVPPVVTAPPPATLPAIPMLSEWENQMKTFGVRHCNYLKGTSGTADERLSATYYDAQWVYFQMADYTRDNSWMECAQAAEKVYRDQYVLPANGNATGYWNFTHGLTQDYLRTGDETSRQAVFALATRAAFAPDDTPISYTVSADASREVAYAIMAYLNGELIGGPRRARLSPLVNQALGHIDQWCVSRTASYVRPFMVALTAHALISYAEQVGDSRVLPALITAADWIWDHTWQPQNEAFGYTDRQTGGGGTEPAPDLNMLIAYFYGWLYRQTGEARFLERGDKIFAGGVKSAYLVNPKQFNQNYRLSIQYVNLRQGK